MNMHNSHQLPTLRKLLKATSIAVVVAGAILVTTVLPAEYGVDPTGIGKAMGLTSLSAANPKPSGQSLDTAKQSKNAASPEPSVKSPAGIVTKSNFSLRNDEMSITLNPAEGAEIKVTMRKGEQLVYRWVAEGGLVNVDLHGENVNDGDKSTSYLKAMQIANDQGAFIAPYDGTHGWFWRNRGDKPVTVKVKVSGFYEKFDRVK
jgi:hypothetical protein